jgi:NADH-quinone oxidoreductase subunit C
MTASEIILLLNDTFGPRIVASFNDKHPRIHINAADWRPVAEFLRFDPRLLFDWLACLSGIDYAADDQLCVAYDLWSFDLRHSFAVKAYMPRQSPKIASVVDLWSAADWHEREAFDFFGIPFDGHPDPRRILLADDWVGHPLLKDYVFPREYHGIPATIPTDWKGMQKEQMHGQIEE